MFEVSSKNYTFLYPLFSLSQPPSTVSEENHLDFCENWVLTKFGWKIKILRFRNDFWVLFISSSGDQINSPICQNPLGFSSRVILISFCEQARNWARGPKTQKFKVLRFEPNFRGRLVMTSKDTPWPNFTKKTLTNLFIHDSSEEHAFPQILSPNHTGSSKFSLMVSKFCDLDSSLF